MLSLLVSRRVTRPMGFVFVLGAGNPIFGSSSRMKGQAASDSLGSTPSAPNASSAARSPSIQAPWAVP